MTLQELAFLGDPVALERAVASGVDVDSVDVDGDTALMVAIEHIRLASVEALLRLGASPNQRDSAGDTPLHLAVDISLEAGKQQFDSTGEIGTVGEDVIARLLAYGADPHVRNARGESAFDWARQSGHEGALALFASSMVSTAQSSVAPDSPSSVAPPGGGSPSSGPRVNAGIGHQDSKEDPDKDGP